MLEEGNQPNLFVLVVREFSLCQDKVSVLPSLWREDGGERWREGCERVLAVSVLTNLVVASSLTH